MNFFIISYFIIILDLISEEMREQYTRGDKNHKFLICGKCNQESTGTWNNMCVDCIRMLLVGSASTPYTQYDKQSHIKESVHELAKVSSAAGDYRMKTNKQTESLGR